MTHQRIATLLAAVEFYEDLSPEARTWLRKADKDKIDQLNSTLDFTHASKIIWKFIWVGGGMVVAAFVGFSSLWKTFGEYITVKFK